MTTVFLSDESATEKLGKLLARATRPITIGVGAATVALAESPDTAQEHGTLGGRIFLSGDLGAGKTTLTRGLLRGYGYQGAAKSPTYTLVEPYELADCNLYHFDLYRLADPEEVEFLGVWEYFDDINLCVVEWAEKGKGHLPCPDLEIQIVQDGQGRRASWQARSEKGELVEHRLSVLVDQETDWRETDRKDNT